MSMTDAKLKPKRVLLGTIVGVHGIRGDVIVRSYTQEPENIARYGELEAADGKAVPALRVVRITDRGVVARLAGVLDRTKAETYKGTELWIARNRLPDADEAEFYHADLIGLDAVSPEGKDIGKVIAVENFGAGDLLEVRLAGTKRTEYVPFTNDCVPVVDVAGGRCVVLMPSVVEEDVGEIVDDTELPGDKT